METINITKEETVLRDFADGNSVQVRVTVSPSKEREFQKGQTVRVVHGNEESTARIVSDPLVVQPKGEDGTETISLIVEKTKS